MPLTQLSRLVLPAPLGPISANSSPCSTASDTSSSTVKPPKRSESLSIASSAIPPPAAPILLDRAIAAPVAAAGLAEIEFADVLVRNEPLRIAVENDPAVFQHIAVIGHLQRQGGILLDDQNRQRQIAADLHEPLHEVVDNDRRKPKRELVHQQQL